MASANTDPRPSDADAPWFEASIASLQIACSSPGGPGSTTTVGFSTPSGGVTTSPGAVPAGPSVPGTSRAAIAPSMSMTAPSGPCSMPLILDSGSRRGSWVRLSASAWSRPSSPYTARPATAPTICRDLSCCLRRCARGTISRSVRSAPMGASWRIVSTASASMMRSCSRTSPCSPCMAPPDRTKARRRRNSGSSGKREARCALIFSNE